MKRVGILTFLHNGNYGSSLQAYALQRVIRQMGYDCEHLDYRPDRQEKILNLIRSGNSLMLLMDGARKRKVRGAQEGMREKIRKINAFYERKLTLTSPCRNRKDLEEVSRKDDILVCGSDQIWNPVWMNPAYFLDFGDPDKPRIAYAPSLGIQNTPGKRKSRMIRRMLSRFDAISVREEEGARLLVPIIGQKPEVMPDPVCLLTRTEWEESCGSVPSGDPYMLCYFIGENTAYWERARDIHQKTGLRILVVPVTADSYAQPLDRLDGAGPEDFLGAIRGAELVCTDSFHGLAFATIFEKKVELIRRYRDDDRESKNSRVDHFLREIQTKGLETMRKEGLRWLAARLKEAEQNTRAGAEKS